MLHINAQDHYLVEFAKFSPPEQAQIKNYEGFPAEAFLASDTDGTEHFLNDYRGKTVVLWFWSKEDDISMEWLNRMNLLQIQYLEEVKIFGFATEEKPEVQSIIVNNAIVFSNIPNSTVFAEMAYAGDLGLGRMFIIDKAGIIQEVVPRSYFESKSADELSPEIDAIIKKIAFN